MTATATPPTRPQKYIASAYDSGLGRTKRYFVEATSLDHAKQVIAESGLVDAEVESYRQFRLRRRRRKFMLFAGVLAALGVTVGLLTWRPWEMIDWSSSNPSRQAGGGEGATVPAGDIGKPSMEDFDQRYDLDDPAVYLTPPPAEKYDITRCPCASARTGITACLLLCRFSIDHSPNAALVRLA